MAEVTLGDLLLQIARDPEIRLQVYDLLREYCHQCRNRLNSLKLSLYLARKQSGPTTEKDWIEIEGSYRALEFRVEQLQFLCKPIALKRVTLGLDLLIDDRREAWSRLMEGQGRTMEVVPPPERAVVSFDVETLGRALDAIVAWRAKESTAARSARLRWWVDAGMVHLSWEEPATAPYLLDPSRGEDQTPWTLPLLARVAQAHGGDYQIRSGPGWRLDITWTA